MNESKLHIDDEILDELVTGNLRGERYRSVLQALEARPHLWRKCAIAFLQEQALTQDLKTLAQGDIDWTAEFRESVERGASQKLLLDRKSPSLAKHAVLLQRISALAALLIVSFSIGWMGAGLRNNRVSNNTDPNNTTQAGVLGAGALPGFPSSQVTEPAIDRSISNSAMLANNEFLPIDLQAPPELLELERAGRIRIETVDALMRIRLDDGTSAIVPVQQFHVVPVIFSY